MAKKNIFTEKTCLDQIVDSLNEKAQAEQDTNDKHLHSNPDNWTGDDEHGQHLKIYRWCKMFHEFDFIIQM